MNFEFKCPQCGKSVECDEAFRGQVAECPHCGKGIVVPREKPRTQMPKIQMQRNLYDKKASVLHSQKDPSLKPQPDHVSVGVLPIPSEKECLKAWVKYWLARLLIAFVLPFICVFICVVVMKSSGRVPFVEWPGEFQERMIHIGYFGLLILCIYIGWKFSWWSYKKFVVRNLILDNSAYNMFSSWLVPILIGIVISLLIPANALLEVLGTYGLIVWSLTIWVLLDYGMFRFLSVKMLCGQKVDLNPGWVCALIGFCILVTIVFGFGQVLLRMEHMDDSRHHDADKIYERMKGLDDSRHHDASQIYERMKGLDDSRHHDANKIYERMGQMKLY